jgi:hypothetical protein
MFYVWLCSYIDVGTHLFCQLTLVNNENQVTLVNIENQSFSFVNFKIRSLDYRTRTFNIRKLYYVKGGEFAK